MANASGPMIFKLIPEAMAKIGAIGKDSAATNYNGKMMYKFRGIDAVYNALNPVMAELGLFIVPEVLDQAREERTTKGEKPTTLIYSIVTVKFTMFAPDGSSVSGSVIGEGMDSGDKATNKAMSAALKYYCFQTFMIPTEEMRDPDSEVHEVTPERTSPVAPAPVKNENKAQVETAAKIPQAKPANPVFQYIGNEQKYMAERLNLTAMEMKLKFAEWRKELVKSGTVEDIAPVDLSMDQAKQLVEAIYKTFMTDKGDKK